MDIYIRYLWTTVMLANAVLRMLHTYIVVHYTTLDVLVTLREAFRLKMLQPGKGGGATRQR